MKSVRPAMLTVFMMSILGAAATSPPARAQALVTASKVAEITAFGGYTYTEPDYGPNSVKGFTLGSDFTIFRSWFVDPSLEVRFNHATGRPINFTGEVITERAILVGPRAQKDYGRFHPYIDFLVGVGHIAYNPPPTFSPNDHGDSGVSLTYGIGTDIDLVHNFSLKLDFQQQNWNLGKNLPFQPDGSNYTLTPRNLTVGVTYHVPFAGLRKQRELR